MEMDKMRAAEELWRAGDSALQLAKALLKAAHRPEETVDYYPYGPEGSGPRMGRVLPETYVYQELYPIAMLLDPEQREVLAGAVLIVEAVQQADVNRLVRQQVPVAVAAVEAAAASGRLRAVLAGPPPEADPDEWAERYGWIDHQEAEEYEAAAWKRFLDAVSVIQKFYITRAILRIVLGQEPVGQRAREIWQRLKTIAEE